MKNEEREIYKAITNYLGYQYPDLIFRFDFAAGLWLNKFHAMLHSKLNPIRGFPDLFIAYKNLKYNGLFIEIKTEKSSPFKKNGELRNGDHLIEQQMVLNKLNDQGYYSVFGIGFDNCKKIIDDYMNNKL
jgi:hypothetical protein